MRLTSSVSIVSLLLVAGTAGAAAIPWSNASGSNTRFNWTGGQSGDALWGDPVVTTAGFWFTAMSPSFKTESTYPASNSLASTVQVTINALGKPKITELHIREYGTYSGDVADVAQTTGTLTLTLINPSGGTQALGNINFGFNPANHTWTAWKDVDMTSAPMPVGGMYIFAISATNHLKATPDNIGATTAMIQKVSGRIIIPEPATLALALVGFAMLSVRRSR